MTEEEKKVIENIENSIECLSFPSYFGEGSFIMNIELNDLKIILNLISKQQSDIEIKDKVIDLIIDDFQTEGYFKKMTYEQVKKYYDNRNELKQEINTLPLNLDLTAK